jgi:hypothetical protein
MWMSTVVNLALTSNGEDNLAPSAILWFGAAVLTLLAITQIIRILKGGQFSASFTKLYGLIFIVVLGTVLVFVDVPEEAKGAAYALFGVAAGYFATSGRSPKTGKDDDRAH